VHILDGNAILADSLERFVVSNALGAFLRRQLPKCIYGFLPLFAGLLPLGHAP